jgi:hypothetical protein
MLTHSVHPAATGVTATNADSILATVRGRRAALRTLSRHALPQRWRAAATAGRATVARRRLAKRRWKVSILAIIAVRMFHQEVQLVAEAKRIQQDARDSAQQVRTHCYYTTIARITVHSSTNHHHGLNHCSCLITWLSLELQ